MNLKVLLRRSFLCTHFLQLSTQLSGGKEEEKEKEGNASGSDRHQHSAQVPNFEWMLFTHRFHQCTL